MVPLDQGGSLTLHPSTPQRSQVAPARLLTFHARARRTKVRGPNGLGPRNCVVSVTLVQPRDDRVLGRVVPGLVLGRDRARVSAADAADTSSSAAASVGTQPAVEPVT